MGKKRVMVPVEEVDLSDVKYDFEIIQGPYLSGWAFKLFVWMLEAPLIGSRIVSFVKKQNKITEMLQNTVIPEAPMFRPEFPTQEPEPGVIIINEDDNPQKRVELGVKCLPNYDPSDCWKGDLTQSFRYWKIRDYAYAYRSGLATPSVIAEHIISIIEGNNYNKPPTPLLISFDSDEVRRQAAASTQRFREGNPLSILDGIFMAIKDDIDCYPHPSKGGTTWMHEVRFVKKDAVCVSRLRSCGVIFLGKANMHELGMGTTGYNPNFGTTRNPYAPERYAGGSSSGPAAIVASGLCSAALGTDIGGSVRVPASLCGVVGLKTTFARTDVEGSIWGGTVGIIGPIASSVEDIMLVYAAVLGSSSADRISLKPSPACLPDLSLCNSVNVLGSLRLGKYSAWFNDVFSTDISDKCEDILNQLSETHGCETIEIVIPELQEVRTAHMVSVGSEVLCGLNPDCEDGEGVKLACDTRTNLALFRSFTASDYIAAQSIRRRIMHYHMEIFKKVDVIVTPTNGMTAPAIPPSALKFGETDLQVTGYLMQFSISANLIGLPAISVTVGYDKQGLPIGLQLIGRPWGEASILRLASAIEELCKESKKKPAIFYDVLNTKTSSGV